MMLWGAVLWLFLLYLMQMHSNKAFKTSLYSKTAKIGLIICCWNTECVSEKIDIR